ncbi:hypothetical protein DFH27DRAFT_608267 [Peziza echinospora]|nr:hypothetical protein DFH27DRAFT_608267 [Peziza echinospora]
MKGFTKSSEVIVVGGLEREALDTTSRVRKEKIGSRYVRYSDQHRNRRSLESVSPWVFIIAGVGILTVPKYKLTAAKKRTIPENKHAPSAGIHLHNPPSDISKTRHFSSGNTPHINTRYSGG